MKIIDFKHRVPVQIRFNDIDIMGHVNNAVHQYYYDFGRIQYFKDVFGAMPDWFGKTVVVARISVDFLKPIILDDEVEVLTRITKLGNKSLTMQQCIVRKGMEEIKSQNKTIMVGIDQKEGETMVLLNEWREKIKNYEDL